MTVFLKQTRLCRTLVNKNPVFKNLHCFQRQPVQQQTNFHSDVKQGYRLQQHYPERPISAHRSQFRLYKYIMGSINCKEYVTTSNNDACANQADGGTTGSYQSTSEANMSEYTDPVAVCNATDINDNEMKQLDFNADTKILLIKQHGRLSAIGNKCSHYGAPLHTGALGQGRVRCPWHGACFDIETGDIEDFPGLDSIPCYKVEVEQNGKVMVRAKRRDLENSKRLRNMVKRSKEDERTYIVVGGGPSGGVCVETLRQEGFTGRIVMLCKEKNLPYDRVKISKSFDIAIETIQFRNEEFYKTYSIEVMLDVEATKLDVPNKTIHASNGTTIKFDKLFLATGSSPTKPPIKGSDLGNVVTVRSYADAVEINKKLNKEMNVVCLGASFIALESASFLVSKVKSVTLIGRENVPLKQIFGDQIGERVLKLFQDNNVTMIMESGIEEIFGKNGNVSEVQLNDGSKIPCDLLVMGTGVRSNTDFLHDSGININPNGSIDTDMHLMTNIPDIYVGGDIANAPIFSIGQQRATIGHYQLAQYHGRVAAINMAASREKKLHTVPFFFTMLFGKGIRYSGYGKFSDVVIEGDLENLKFVAYFLDENNAVVSVASCGRDPIVSKFAELQSQGKKIYRCDIVDKDDPEGWTKLLYERPLSSC